MFVTTGWADRRLEPLRDSDFSKMYCGDGNKELNKKDHSHVALLIGLDRVMPCRIAYVAVQASYIAH
jgi:hypothetical protein